MLLCHALPCGAPGLVASLWQRLMNSIWLPGDPRVLLGRMPRELGARHVATFPALGAGGVDREEPRGGNVSSTLAVNSNIKYWQGSLSQTQKN